MRYARIVDSTVAELREFANVPNPNPAKGLVWKPCPHGSKPSVDPLTEVLTGPTYNIGGTEVTELFSKRNKTAPEISTDKDNAVASLNGGYGPLIQALFNLHNRIRVLEGQAPHTLAQFRTGLKAML